MNFARHCIILFILFFIGAHAVNASFEITEIMYDPTGTDSNREWVEVQNTGTDTLDLSKWYFFTDGTKHAIAQLGTATIAPGVYAVIAQNPGKFKIDWPNYSGLLFDSSWTDLTNKGETIALKDPNLNIVSSVIFPSSSSLSDGYSLQKINGTWIGSKPTPGEENKETPKIVKVETPQLSSTTQVTTSPNTSKTPKKKSSRKNSYGSASTSDPSTINLDNVSDSSNDDSVTISKSTLAWLGLVGVIVIGSGATLLFYRKKSKAEVLTSKDMTILE